MRQPRDLHLVVSADTLLLFRHCGVERELTFSGHAAAGAEG